MRGFDTIATVDWSASASPTAKQPSKDAIWVCAARRSEAGIEGSRYFRTRHAAETHLTHLIDTERTANRRLLIGFDFPFGYPAGFARALTGSNDPFAVWTWLAARIADDAQNRNNRFDVASEMNRRLPGTGPFWGKPRRDRWPDVPYTKQAITFDVFAEMRACDRVARTSSSCFQLCYPPTVGSQMLVGLPMLTRLRRGGGVAVWPFDAWQTAPVVLAEIWPGLIEASVRDAMRTEPGTIRDAIQVERLARALSRLPARNLTEMMHGLPDAAREEAWILGACAKARLDRLAHDTATRYLPPGPPTAETR